MIETIDIIEELVPRKLLTENVTASYERGKIIYTWYGKVYIFPLEDILAENNIKSMSLEDILIRYIQQRASITTKEIQSKGKSVLTSHGVRTILQRGHKIHWINDPNIPSLTPPKISDFSFELAGGLIRVFSTNINTMCHESGGWGKDFISGIIDDVFDIDCDKSAIGVHIDPIQPLVIGHEKLVKRLCLENEGRSLIYPRHLLVR